MRSIPLFLIGVLLLSGCCNLSQVRAGEEETSSSDTVIYCDPGRFTGSSFTLPIFNCDYVKAEGNVIHVSLDSPNVRKIHLINSSEVAASGLFVPRNMFPNSTGAFEPRPASSLLTQVISSNASSAGPQFAGAQAFHCALSDYSISDRTLNMTYVCDKELPLGGPITYFIQLHMPLTADKSVDANSGFEWCTPHETYASCSVELEICAEKR